MSRTEALGIYSIIRGSMDSLKGTTSRSCPLCGGPQALFVRRVGLNVVRCQSCSLGALEGGDEAANAAYGEFYTSRHADPLTAERFDDLLRDLAAFRTGRSLLEIGFGDGGFLRRARELGWDVIGTETAGGTVGRLAAEGLDVRLGEHAASTVPAGSCDAVVMLEVLEHLGFPRDPGRGGERAPAGRSAPHCPRRTRTA